MSTRSRLLRGVGYGAFALATLGMLDTTPAPVNEVIWTQGAHGGGGASNGQPVELHDWRSINDLFKTDKQEAIQAARARQLAEDDIMLSAIMSAVTEDLI